MDNIPDAAFLLDSLLQAKANLTEEGGSFPVLHRLVVKRGSHSAEDKKFNIYPELLYA